jgi:hypothetical protein
MKRLLILTAYGAVHFGDYASRNATWARLQRQFIETTTADYDYAVYLNRTERTLFDHAIIIGENSQPISHLETLRTLNERLVFARANPYENYLILDSDAFPVREGWLELLLERMGPRRFAAPVRFENLDTFPHQCALFIKGEAINDPFEFTPEMRYQNLLKERHLEVSTGLSMEQCFPLVRTNRYNVHPILAGVYYDMFYHHGAGSRRAYLRPMMSSGYYDHLVPDHLDQEEPLFQELAKDPVAFIARLRGLTQ